MAVDWSRTYAEFLGGASLAELARRHGLSYSALYRRARRDAWTQERERVRGNMAEAVADRLGGSAADAAELVREAENQAVNSVYQLACMLGEKIEETHTANLDDVNALARLIGSMKVLHEIIMPQERDTVRIELGEGIRELGA